MPSYRRLIKYVVATFMPHDAYQHTCNVSSPPARTHHSFFSFSVSNSAARDRACTSCGGPPPPLSLLRIAATDADADAVHAPTVISHVRPPVCMYRVRPPPSKSPPNHHRAHLRVPSINYLTYYMAAIATHPRSLVRDSDLACDASALVRSMSGCNPFGSGSIKEQMVGCCQKTLVGGCSPRNS